MRPQRSKMSIPFKLSDVHLCQGLKSIFPSQNLYLYQELKSPYHHQELKTIQLGATQLKTS